MFEYYNIRESVFNIKMACGLVANNCSRPIWYDINSLKTSHSVRKF